MLTALAEGILWVAEIPSRIEMIDWRADQIWKTFLHNHARALIAVDFFCRSNGHISSAPRLPGSGAPAAQNLAFQYYRFALGFLDRTT